MQVFDYSSSKNFAEIVGIKIFSTGTTSFAHVLAIDLFNKTISGS